VPSAARGREERTAEKKGRVIWYMTEAHAAGLRQALVCACNVGNVGNVGRLGCLLFYVLRAS
jgi:hypothetical protein